MADYRPDMTWSWASPQVTTPSQPQNTTLPTWGAVGSPGMPGTAYDPNAPVSLARKAVGYAGLGGLASVTEYGTWAEYRAAHPTLAAVLPVFCTVSGLASAYHGYKRNRNSVGWAVLWFLGGATAPILMPAIAVFQGYAKPAR